MYLFSDVQLFYLLASNNLHLMQVFIFFYYVTQMYDGKMQ